MVAEFPSAVRLLPHGHGPAGGGGAGPAEVSEVPAGVTHLEPGRTMGGSQDVTRPHAQPAATRGALRTPRLLAAAAASTCLILTGCGYVEARVQMKKGNEYYNTKKYEQAVEAYTKVIQADPTYKDAHFNLGLAYLALYQPGSIHEKDIMYSQGAIKAFKDYLALDPENEKVKNYLIETCQKSHNQEEAIRFFEEEHRKHPDDVKAISMIANLYTKQGEIDIALEWLAKRVALEPDNPEAYYTIGVNCWARSYNRMDLSLEQRFAVLDKGLAALDKAIELKPAYGEAYAYKNLVYRQKAAFEPDATKRLEYTQAADEFQRKATELLRAAQQKAAQDDSKAEGR
jgi:predicted Zn-dependent protease